MFVYNIEILVFLTLHFCDNFTIVKFHLQELPQIKGFITMTPCPSTHFVRAHGAGWNAVRANVVMINARQNDDPKRNG